VRYLSVCSGIEAASVAWESLGWTSVAFAEIEKFPSKVLAHHYPGVANLGDMTRFREWDIERDAVDVLVGGTPCQSFSVAGLRKGLDDPRGNLALTFIAMVDHYRPEWVIWENVPGVLSSSGGRDFGSFLGALGNIGYGFAYRVLDAQYFGVPQRRRRVFVVAHSSGDSRRAAEVLFEPESLRGDSTKGRKTGQDTAQCLTTGTGCRYDPNTETLIPITFRKSRRAQSAEDFETWVPDGVTNTLNCFDTGDIRSVDIVVESFAQNQLGELRTSPIASTLGTNSNASGRNTAMVIQPIALAENTIGRQPLNGGNGDGYTVGGPMYTLNATGVHGVAHPAHAFKIRGVGHYTGTNGGVAKPGTGGSGYMGQDEKAYTIATSQDQQIMHGMAVRRLTPTECERLQGFPDGYTNIMPETPDGPRYKALGNSMAVPVMRWIGSRIALATK
jgi:DNA (cytosine-5)-methyltransferase 1